MVLFAGYQRRISRFNDKVVPLSAKGITFGEIKGFLKEEYGVDVSKELLFCAKEPIISNTSMLDKPLLFQRLYPSNSSSADVGTKQEPKSKTKAIKRKFTHLEWIQIIEDFNPAFSSSRWAGR